MQLLSGFMFDIKTLTLLTVFTNRCINHNDVLYSFSVSTQDQSSADLSSHTRYECDLITIAWNV